MSCVCWILTQSRDDIAQCDKWFIDAATFLQSVTFGPSRISSLADKQYKK